MILSTFSFISTCLVIISSHPSVIVTHSVLLMPADWKLYEVMLWSFGLIRNTFSCQSCLPYSLTLLFLTRHTKDRCACLSHIVMRWKTPKEWDIETSFLQKRYFLRQYIYYCISSLFKLFRWASVVCGMVQIRSYVETDPWLVWQHCNITTLQSSLSNHHFLLLTNDHTIG